MHIDELLQRVRDELEYPVSTDALLERFGDTEIEFGEGDETPLYAEMLRERLEEREAPTPPSEVDPGDLEHSIEEFESEEHLRKYLTYAEHP